VTTAYIESSALVKLAIHESETPVLRRQLRTHEHMVSSDLSTVEVSRAAFRRRGQDGLVQARAALLPINLIPIDRPVIDMACQLAPPTLRSLDAIHIATALAVGRDDVVFYAYDQRALDAARAAGLTVASP
jgi:predicted nucleic acid-binding protein